MVKYEFEIKGTSTEHVIAAMTAFLYIPDIVDAALHIGNCEYIPMPDDEFASLWAESFNQHFKPTATDVIDVYKVNRVGALGVGYLNGIRSKHRVAIMIPPEALEMGREPVMYVCGDDDMGDRFALEFMLELFEKGGELLKED